MMLGKNLEPCFLAVLCLLATSCTTASPSATGADYEILFIGNSHSSSNGLPELVAKLIETGLPGKTAYANDVPRWGFLAERLKDGLTQKTLQNNSWSHVILQGQKYSSSGRYYYPTDAAIEWIRRIKKKNSVPILFPEWARKGNHEEGQRIHKLHLQIAAVESVCVAPVGLAWELMRAVDPSLRMHAADGNHASLNGTLLTAFIFYEVITSQSAANLPYDPHIKVNADNQKKLREAASRTLEIHPACS